MSDERAIRELFSTWLQASAVGDAESIAPLMAEDVVFLQPGRPPMEGRQAFLDAFRSGLEHVRIKPSGELTEITIAGDFAYTSAHLEVAVTPIAGGSTTRLSGHTLTVFRKQPGGSWVIVRDANMLTPAR